MAVALYASLALAALGVWFAKSRKETKPPYPPGPKRQFLLGNASDFPTDKPWETFTQWKEQYGELVYLSILNKKILVLNSAEACQDLLEKRSSKFSDRPRLVMVNELMGMGWSMPLMQYTPRWRAHRRLFHQFFNDRAVKDYRPDQEKHAHNLLYRILQAPKQFKKHARLAFTATMTDIVYDLQVTSPDDQYVQIAEDAVAAGSQAAGAGAYLVDLIPALKHIPAWFPFATFQRQAAEWRVPSVAMKTFPYEHVKRAITAGTAGPSVLSSMMSRDESEKAITEEGAVLEESAEEVAANCAAVAFGAGSDTTLSTLEAFYFAMADNVDIQKAAQAEIDSAVGQERLPSFEDLNQLPLVQAILMESLRWHNVAPLGIVHASTEDDVYKGHFIPAGTMVIPNVYGILHDPAVYSEPYKFNPSRWIGEDGKVNFNLDLLAFGFGRRICPGRYFAADSLYVILATTLASFNILPPKDASGHRKDMPPFEVTNGVFSYPTDFEVSFEPRSEKSARLVRDAQL